MEPPDIAPSAEAGWLDEEEPSDLLPCAGPASVVPFSAAKAATGEASMIAAAAITILRADIYAFSDGPSELHLCTIVPEGHKGGSPASKPAGQISSAAPHKYIGEVGDAMAAEKSSRAMNRSATSAAVRRRP